MCRAQGAPSLTFKWFREGREIASGDRAKYGIVDRGLDPLTWQSQLRVADVKMKDYGPYSCQVRSLLLIGHSIKACENK